MAKKITLLSDLSQEEGAETLNFSIGTDVYAVDLTSAELAAFLKANKRYVDAATLVRSRTSNGSAPNPEEMRTWLRANGWEVSDKGRIAAPLQDAYNKAHGLA